MDDFLKPRCVDDHGHDLERFQARPARSKRCSTCRTATPRAVAVFAHPHPQHGGTMHTKALYQAAKALTRIGVAALRFNFRGVGRSAGAFDEGHGEKDDFAPPSIHGGALPGLPIWAAGMSFGSWVALTSRRRRSARVGAARHRAAGRIATTSTS